MRFKTDNDPENNEIVFEYNILELDTDYFADPYAEDKGGHSDVKRNNKFVLVDIGAYNNGKGFWTGGVNTRKAEIKLLQPILTNNKAFKALHRIRGYMDYEDTSMVDTNDLRKIGVLVKATDNDILKNSENCFFVD